MHCILSLDGDSFPYKILPTYSAKGSVKNLDPGWLILSQIYQLD